MVAPRLEHLLLQRDSVETDSDNDASFIDIETEITTIRSYIPQLYPLPSLTHLTRLLHNIDFNLVPDKWHILIKEIATIPTLKYPKVAANGE
ncbi:hypothetical protein M422DRAFT_271139 [Sphaerobolus stellatus SS14]|uniref:Uncharacterized protein n=1 Tax=Sphaerobolus stellatus (strain SS14) TaxID=990650 RepID=A0A0C9UQQ1_SPHS4|nr:hypothetical protein M422DRAFT_271139 [Sphaerobolus stellatus SS14]